MPNKIKIFIALVAAIALFSVYQLNDYVRTLANKSVSFAQISGLSAPDLDPDHDGLSNNEEDFWNTDPNNTDTDGDGFKDGEEVGSGHDPNKSGPNDLLNDNNLTEQFADLTLAGLVEGSLKYDDANYEESVDDFTSALVSDALQSFDKRIKNITLVDDTKSNQQEYINAVAPQFKNFLKLYTDELQKLGHNLDLIGANGFKDQSVVRYYQNETTQLESIFNETLPIQVPKSWQANHSAFLKATGNLAEYDRAIANGDKDPLKATVALKALANIVDLVSNISQAYAMKIQSQNLNVKGTIFER